MSSDLNRVMIIGRLVRDPELKYTPNGKEVCNFSVAVNSWNGKEEVGNFFDCVIWGKRAENLTQYCKKGSVIGIEGRLQQRRWEDQNGNKRSTVEIVVDSAQFLSSRDSDSKGAPSAPVDNGPFDDTSVPF